MARLKSIRLAMFWSDCMLVIYWQYWSQIESLSDSLHSHSRKSVLHGAPSHNHLDSPLELEPNDPSEGIRAINQALGNSVVGLDSIHIGVAGEDDGTPVRSELQLESEVSHQHVDVLKGLSLLKMSRNQSTFLMQFGQD